MLKVFYKATKEEQLQELKQFRKDALVVVEEASKSDIREVAKLAGIVYADLKDALDEHEIPRVERQNGALLLFIRQPSNLHRGIYTEPVTLVYTAKFLAVVAIHKNDLLNEMLTGKLEQTTEQRTQLLLSLLLRVARQYSREIKQVADTVARQKKEFERVDSDDIVLLARSEEVLNQYVSALVPMKNMIESIQSRGYIKLDEEDDDLLQDLLIGINQSADVCTVNVKSIRNLRDAYQIIFTNDLNRIIKLLTLFTIVMTIPTIVSSLYGMNVRLPFDKDPLAFGYILVVIVGLSIGALAVFRLKKWF